MSRRTLTWTAKNRLEYFYFRDGEKFYMRYKLNSALELDTVDGELAILNPAKGTFSYYSAATEPFLRLFENPASIEDLVAFNLVPADELSAVSEFMTHLVMAGVLVAEPEAEQGVRPEYAYERPLFISNKKESADDFAYLLPIVGSGH
jgi:hypothetical protein